jgi:hypothetical protein
VVREDGVSETGGGVSGGQSAEKDAPEGLRRAGYNIAAAALRDAADDLEGRLGTKGAPRNLWEFRAWLRARADELEARIASPEVSDR